MGDIVNLKRFKKRLERERAAQQAATNRARSGRTRSGRALDEQLERRASELLDQHRMDGEDAT
jgi:hypothetical protein